MTGVFIHSRKSRKVVLVAGMLLLVIGGACRKRANSNANSTPSPQVATGSEQAKNQARTLVQQARELYKNDEDEKAAEVLKQAISYDPNNAEAHLRLGMSYAALGKQIEAEE